MDSSTVVEKKILLADDEAGVREAFKLLLSVDRHHVTTAANGREALNLFESERFDLVITDLAMPEMEGDQLATEIRQRVPKQPIIMATAYAERMDRPAKPVDAVIPKPVGFADLRRIIASLLL